MNSPALYLIGITMEEDVSQISDNVADVAHIVAVSLKGILIFFMDLRF